MIKTLKQLKSGIHANAVKRKFSSSYNQPMSGNDMPRAGGIATFMRLPHYSSAKGLDVGILGVPFDCGTSNRSGARFGPRQIRSESSLLRPCNASTGDEPFSNLQVGDLGDVPITIYNVFEAIKDIRKFISQVLKEECTPLTMGGDHTITYPVLQAMKDKYGPVGLVHVDAHADVNDTMMGCKIAHGTTFRRAVEEGLLDLKRVVQIGLRGTSYTPTDFQWSVDQGFRLVLAEECWHSSMTPLMDDIRKQMGKAPVYVSLDIDALDPAFAPGTEKQQILLLSPNNLLSIVDFNPQRRKPEISPSDVHITGTPEIAGLTTIQMLEIIRGLKGLNIIGGDLVEVSPPYDPSGNTALTAANLLFELLCIFAKNK